MQFLRIWEPSTHHYFSYVWYFLIGMTWPNMEICSSCTFPGNREALLGRGVYAPWSLRHFTPFSLSPSIFRCSLPFTNFHCSFFISLCSPLHFNLSSFSLINSLAPCSISLFCCSQLPFPSFCAPCSLPYFRPCSLVPWVSRVILPATWLPLMGVQ